MFFSICISSYNRSRTIKKTLISIANQNFRDFEVIIVDCKSSDDTITVIGEFFDSDSFKEHPFKYHLIKEDWAPTTVEDWNEPLKYAVGKYIAVLEGDDQFLPNHLYTAYSDLNKMNNIGLYFPGEKYNRQVISSNNIQRNFYFNNVFPAPSEAIFINQNKKGVSYSYNISEYIYAPEMELYITIAQDNFDAFYSETAGVIRDRTKKSRGKWKYYRDHYYFLEKFKYLFQPSLNEYNDCVAKVDRNAYYGLAMDKLYYNGTLSDELREQLKKRHSILKYSFMYIKTTCYLTLRDLKIKFLGHIFSKTN